MNADFEKIFFKELRAILKKNDFLKLNTLNYFYNNSYIQCMFNIQKSKYSKQYYFNLCAKKTSPDISPKEISWGADLILRLENLFPKYSFLIKGINFDENKDKQNYFDFLNLLDTYFLIEIKKLTNIEIFENYIKMQQI
ncbi:MULTISPECIES: DUF4304 domain-containing protein [Neisseria]|jgi:hypothetical protein|uniref:DUF4304 domain-containing protein n=1 Tax=Neisseria sicca VK64 TaxID=1095748 RepID=I2NVB1_NEISI|nr:MULTISPECIES: DUF4304 domain-containing protein [Neisseria]EIG29772.1 hypothetical protein HMPREF1051_0187 [Neisseria sicca VK64]OHR75664.1 hypothetical protein HMPREF3277_00005 [Neisseria sp. HMSC70E02]